jgi:hypothetical protein
MDPTDPTRQENQTRLHTAHTGCIASQPASCHNKCSLAPLVVWPAAQIFRPLLKSKLSENPLSLYYKDVLQCVVLILVLVERVQYWHLLALCAGGIGKRPLTLISALAGDIT